MVHIASKWLPLKHINRTGIKIHEENFSGNEHVTDFEYVRNCLLSDSTPQNMTEK